MKKTLTFLLGGLVLALVVILGLATQQPETYEISQSIQISKAHKEVFPMVANLTAWPNWSPWAERDPKMEIDYSEPSSGRGAFMKWRSQTEGAGTMIITDVVGTEALKMRTEFDEPMTGQAFSYWRIKAIDDNTTQVDWRMEGTNDTFVKKLFYLLLDLQSMLNNDFAKGLNNMKVHLENQ